jgi:hypothetical protein
MGSILNSVELITSIESDRSQYINIYITICIVSALHVYSAVQYNTVCPSTVYLSIV